MTCVEKKFELQVRKWEYRGTRHSDGDSALVVELWLHRVVDDLSGLTFQEWTGQDVSEYLDTLGLVKPYLSSFLRKKIKKIGIFFCGVPTTQRIR